MDRYLRIINNFLHDMATGTWAAGVMVIWLLASRRPTMPAEAAAAVLDASWSVFWLSVVALFVIATTGGVRLRYWRREATPEELQQKRKALILKHIAFVLVYGPGTLWAYELLKP